MLRDLVKTISKECVYWAERDFCHQIHYGLGKRIAEARCTENAKKITSPPEPKRNSVEANITLPCSTSQTWFSLAADQFSITLETGRSHTTLTPYPFTVHNAKQGEKIFPKISKTK